MMRQYHAIKRENPDSILLFRMGDFYETFGDDAKIVAKDVGISLTARDKNSDNPIHFIYQPRSNAAATYVVFTLPVWSFKAVNSSFFGTHAAQPGIYTQKFE